jgi:N-acetyl-beta-hexosaminidase
VISAVSIAHWANRLLYRYAANHGIEFVIEIDIGGYARACGQALGKVQMLSHEASELTLENFGVKTARKPQAIAACARA